MVQFYHFLHGFTLHQKSVEILFNKWYDIPKESTHNSAQNLGRGKYGILRIGF